MGELKRDPLDELREIGKVIGDRVGCHDGSADDELHCAIERLADVWQAERADASGRQWKSWAFDVMSGASSITDADGVRIRIGDMLEGTLSGKQFEAVGVAHDGDEWYVFENGGADFYSIPSGYVRHASGPGDEPEDSLRDIEQEVFDYDWGSEEREDKALQLMFRAYRRGRESGDVPQVKAMGGAYDVRDTWISLTQGQETPANEDEETR